MTHAELDALACELGLDAIGAAPAEPYAATERHIRERRARGLFADMRFTMARPEESCHPETLLPGARTVVSAALCYWHPEPERPPGHGRLPRYTWFDAYEELREKLDEPLPADDVHVGPSDHVPWLEDRKWAYIRIEGRNFGDVPLNVELKLEVWDSPNSAGVIIDAVRCAKLAKDRGIGGPLLGPSGYFMKSPPVQYTDDVARAMVEDFASQ